MRKKSRPAIVNVAVSGLGFIGIKHLQSWQRLKKARIVAVCGGKRLPVDGKIAGVSGNLAGPDSLTLGSRVKVFTNFDEMLGDDEIDLIDICVPTALHHIQAISALEAGKHVICEKPMTRTSFLARKITMAARSAEGFFMPAMVLRFWPEWAWLKEVVNRKLYGRVLAARFRRVAEPPGWGQRQYFKGSLSGGALFDLHIHDADFVQYLFGMPKSVFAAGRTCFSGAIDHVVTQYEVSGGAVVHAEGSWLMTKGHGFNMAYTVNFETATIDYDFSRGKKALRICQKGRAPRVVECNGADGYLQELAYMLGCIRENRRPALVTAEDGLRSVQICEAEEKSIKTGSCVRCR